MLTSHNAFDSMPLCSTYSFGTGIGCVKKHQFFITVLTKVEPWAKPLQPADPIFLSTTSLTEALRSRLADSAGMLVKESM